MIVGFIHDHGVAYDKLFRRVAISPVIYQNILEVDNLQKRVNIGCTITSFSNTYVTSLA